ncbi:MAG: bifunctional diaminohydroxyphosphoribosylaminopyrimidine deaminase/5-amino-6-(5-phosphoribosylamino)uracil reductase RibD [Micrococcales bacterium]|nr:bifunctional diaminohydroxyphosphoribosylaminopyrimidine deaminase/5-amino-6-(5-phosphoribosylamino)uracil reductase RibD [Micrococcales bacterium]
MTHTHSPDATSPATGTELAAMRHAFTLAGRGPAHGPNPRVAAVLLSPDGARLGEGWHMGAGTPHAEVAALADATAAGHDPRGATLVVTLEPCAHTGQTGPCTQVLLDAGVARVVFAITDPNPVACDGAASLAAAGVDVVGPVLADEARAVLGPWWSAVSQGRPFVTVKVATTLDGRVAAADGTSRWISSPASRVHAHGVRAQVDAIAVGTGTMLVDNPALTARTDEGLAAHQPLRVVVGHRDVPPGAALRGPGGTLVQVRSHDPADVLAALPGVRHLLVEGGPRLTAAFVRAGLVDQVHAYVAPVLLGAGPPAVADLGITTIADALRLEVVATEQLGPDVFITLNPPTQPHEMEC